MLTSDRGRYIQVSEFPVSHSLLMERDAQYTADTLLETRVMRN